MRWTTSGNRLIHDLVDLWTGYAFLCAPGIWPTRLKERIATGLDVFIRFHGRKHPVDMGDTAIEIISRINRLFRSPSMYQNFFSLLVFY